MDLTALLGGLGALPTLVTFFVLAAIFNGLFGFNIPFFNGFGN